LALRLGHNTVTRRQNKCYLCFPYRHIFLYVSNLILTCNLSLFFFKLTFPFAKKRKKSTSQQYEKRCSSCLHRKGGDREYPFIIKVGSTKGNNPPNIFRDVEYFFLDTPSLSQLVLFPSLEQQEILEQYNCKDKIIKIDFQEATGASLWQLRGKKTLSYKGEWVQPSEADLTNDTYLRFLRDHGKETSPTFLVSNWSRDEMHDLLTARDDPGIDSSAKECSQVAAALCHLSIRGTQTYGGGQ